MSTSKVISLAVVLFAAGSGIARAGDSGDVAAETKLPVAVVENVFTNVDAFFASADAPSNRLTSGIFKDITLKAVRGRMGALDDAQPGKVSESSDEEANATYRAAVRTTSHDTSETSECVANKVSLAASEGVPAIKDGTFVFDNAHPRVSSWGWTMTFCRTPTGNGGHSAWTLAPAGK
jgi:hypothetical protein